MLSLPPPGVTPQAPALPLADKDVYAATETLTPQGVHHHHHHHHHHPQQQQQHPSPQLSCPCASLLPRLLAAHRMEVRRLLRGALVSLGRRVDALERTAGTGVGRRRSRKRNRSHVTPQADHKKDLDAFPSLVSSSCSPHVTSSSHPWPSSVLDSSPLWHSSSQSEHKSGLEGRGIKRRKRSITGGEREAKREDGGGDKEDDERARFVGRMAICQTAGEASDHAPLTLFNFDPRRQDDGGQLVKAVSVAVGRNGYSSSAQDAFDLLRAVSNQWHASSVSHCQWRFSDFTPPLSSRSSCSSRLDVNAMLRLSMVAVATLAASGGWTRWNPRRVLRDWTAPPSLTIDHCYIQTADLRHTRARKRSIHCPRKRLLAPPLPACSDNNVDSPQVTITQSSAGSKEKAKRVSQIRIRRAPPRETPLTPMGLPKVKRLKKKEFSVEEIYTNKNYKCPSNNRSLETIFEEPQEKDGALLLIGQQRRRRLLLFPDFTQPRKRKRPQGVGLPVAAAPRKRTVRRQYRTGPGANDPSDLDVMLVERLSALEDFLTRQGLDV